MITDKINDIITILIESTKSGETKWNLYLGQSSYKNEATLISKSEDGKSSFDVAIKFELSDNDTWKLESSASLWIRNESLPGGSMYLYSGSNKYPDLIKLRNLLKDKYCSAMTPSTKTVEDNLSDIFKGISKSTYRAHQINIVIE